MTTGSRSHLWMGWSTCVSVRRGLLAPGVFVGLLLAVTLPALAAELPRDRDALVQTIRQAIEQHDYERFEQMVFWKDVGTIKRRVVAFQIRHGLGRKIESISVEPFPEHGLDALEASGGLAMNMPVTEQVRVVYAEEPIEPGGKRPTSVFLVGKRDEVYRIGVVVRKMEDDDGD